MKNTLNPPLTAVPRIRIVQYTSTTGKFLEIGNRGNPVIMINITYCAIKQTKNRKYWTIWATPENSASVPISFFRNKLAALTAFHEMATAEEGEVVTLSFLEYFKPIAEAEIQNFIEDKTIFDIPIFREFLMHVSDKKNLKELNETKIAVIKLTNKQVLDLQDGIVNSEVDIQKFTIMLSILTEGYLGLPKTILFKRLLQLSKH